MAIDIQEEVNIFALDLTVTLLQGFEKWRKSAHHRKYTNIQYGI